jgi:RNA polymerase sigma factor (sigma-70 family)
LDERELLQAAYRYALSLTHREADAEDLVQEAWLRLYQQYGGQMERARLFAAVRNLFVDQYRRHQLVVFEPYEEGQVGVDDVGDVVTAEDLEPALAALRPEEREALDRLDFDLEPTAVRLAGLALVGGRYCSIQGQIAAQLKVVDPASKEILTLYVTRIDDELEQLAPLDERYEDLYMRCWRDGERFFALAGYLHRED